jgi:hypothetical protein
MFRSSGAHIATISAKLQNSPHLRSDCQPQLSSVAQRQGVHRDGQRLGLTPFEIEMRGRLWWHIFILDMLCSEDQGIVSQIQPGSHVQGWTDGLLRLIHRGLGYLGIDKRIRV